jgi:hypothetical protein
VAIVQISRITNRKGVTENLPQLSGAEFGWCVDSRQLFIGNGTLEEGAPVIGNTEILTEFSDVVGLSNYTYADSVVGYTAQTGPTANDPVIRTVQAKLDDFASVRDFGATGNGSTDDTAAINRALYQLYCRENNSQIRRSLYFPAGTYKITETITIPTFAKLVGEGADCTIIYMDGAEDISTLNEYVARYGDSRQQTGVNIGANNAIPPQNIEISSMTFRTASENNVFLIDQAKQCWFDSVYFQGSVTQTQIEDSGSTPLPDIAGIRFNSTPALICDTITFDKCAFTNQTYGISTSELTNAITVSNSDFYLLSQGILLEGGNPTGFRVTSNQFDLIYAEGILYDDVNLNISAYNVFLNVGYSIGSSSPVYPCVTFGNDNNCSINDLFARSDADNYQVPRIQVIATSTVAGGTLQQLGRYTRNQGRTFECLDNQSSNQLIFSINLLNTKAFAMQYTIARGTDYRTGVLTVSGGPAYTDDFVDGGDTGIFLAASQSGSQLSVVYTSTNTGTSASLTYSVSHLA